MQLDSQIIGAIIGSVATIFAALLGIFLRPESFATFGFRLRGKKRLSWSSIEQGLTKILGELESVGFVPDYIITVAGSGGMMANWLYKSRNRSIPTYTTLQEPKNNRWTIAPSGHTSIEGNRWVIHVPDCVNDIDKKKS